MKDAKPRLNPTKSQDITIPIDNEPAGEWASHTLSALGPTTSTPYPADRPTEYQHDEGVKRESSHIPIQTASTATTPGLQNVPGAFPTSILTPAGLGEESKLLKDAATNALETAKGYAVTASETVSGYLPASVAAYLPSSPQQPTTLPSSEPAHSAPPSSSGGVGALPGETNIGDERAEEKSVNFAAPPKELGYNPTSMDSSGAQIDPDVKKNSLAHLGDRQGDARPGHSEGVGELPGADNEEGVALLPAERETTAGAYSNKTAFSGASTDASTRSLAGSRAPTDENYIKDGEAGFEQQSAASPTQSNVAPPPTQTGRSHGDGPVTNAREHPLSAHDFGGTHNNLNRAPDSMLATPGHHNNSSYTGGGKDTIAPAVPEKDSNTNKAGPAGTAITSATPDASHPVPDSAPTAPAKKYGIMAKLRGEMKILSGKLEHSEEKIEEGRRLMGKH